MAGLRTGLLEDWFDPACSPDAKRCRQAEPSVRKHGEASQFQGRAKLTLISTLFKLTLKKFKPLLFQKPSSSLDPYPLSLQ
ncbi:MAG: hypothetical protein DRH17_03490 [Deltaproteobacteria bacterium]|nr:MAG: hypothetical protein DRH17_03490 [Deltaproteobacteria bacterium]